ncbi:MAG: TrkH family potassium uptake protein [Desulfobacteraceae bacterium]|nr:MAG: TrkH family potassium uptake protein [Desulfobacteraceae bacterium]
MRPQIIIRYVGFVLLLNGCFLLVSACISAWDNDSAMLPLFYSAMVAFLFGVFPLIFVPSFTSITTREGFLIVITSWILSCLVGLMPYLLWGGEFTLIDAWFESVSGFTTTGSSILTNVEALPRGLLFWRSATQWMGGTGIVIFVLSVLPSMGKAGMVLYRVEMSGVAADNFILSTRTALKIILKVYVGLTIMETVCLLLCGLDLYDAINHSFTTIATGGFSTKNLSIAHYESPLVEGVVMLFMLLSGINFALLFAVASGSFGELWRSSILRYYLVAIICGVCLTALNVYGSVYQTWTDAFRFSAFQVISLGTTTGFATADSSVWPAFSQLLIIYFTIQGACAGSTSGALKADRVVIFWKALIRRIMTIQHPRAVIAVRINKTPLDEDFVDVSTLFISLYTGVLLLSTLILAALGIDLLTAFSGAAATLGGAGPGFGTVGSLSNFNHLPLLAKMILSADMLFGRLEIFGIIIFFMPRSWK